MPCNENNCKKDRIRIKQPLDGQNSVITYDGCKIVIETVFGSCEFFLPKESIHKSLTTNVQFGKTDKTSLMLKVAIQRAKTFAEFKRNKIQEEKLFQLVLELATSCLPMTKLSARRRDLLEAEDEKMGDVSFFEPIEKVLKEPIKLCVEKSQKQKWALRGLALIPSAALCAAVSMAKENQLLNVELPIDCLTYALSAAVGISAYTLMDLLVSEEVADKDYYIALRFIAEKMQSCGENLTNDEIDNLLLDNTIYSVEKAICIMSKSTSVRESISEKSHDDLKKRIGLIEKTRAIRGLLSSQGIIGLVGPQNSGKTLFTNFISRSTYPVGKLTHTETVQMKSISHHIAVVDFPATNSLKKECAQAFNKCGSVSSVIVLIVESTGDANETLAGEIAKVYNIPKYSKTLICINKSWFDLDSVDDDLKDKPDPAEFLKEEYFDKLNKHFEIPNSR